MAYEQLRAPNYPDTFSSVVLDPFSAGFANQRFENSIFSHGNDKQVSWQSFDESSLETFTVRKIGLSEAAPEETDGFQLSTWSLEFKLGAKTLVIDAGKQTVQRYEGEFLVDGSYLDVSDLYVAVINLNYHEAERRKQGWQPAFDHFLRNEVYLDSPEN